MTNSGYSVPWARDRSCHDPDRSFPGRKTAVKTRPRAGASLTAPADTTRASLQFIFTLAVLLFQVVRGRNAANFGVDFGPWSGPAVPRRVCQATEWASATESHTAFDSGGRKFAPRKLQMTMTPSP
ncbi:hypothetical protein XA68_14874 [Ophiocordyceps unilateralis]|uniref:Uncharacterized protein n=1 Tax=Ophiocordyceps unilateralis TaxID=268505 RepID=A0A2A9P8L9_OPHUN|nr:hypothetical protein XA68_14874 [Ophiocordyceps unilateralis]